MLIAKGIEEKDYFNLVEIDGTYIGDPCVHGENLVSTITEQGIMAIVEVKCLFKELSMHAKFLVALLELLKDEVQS